MEHLDQSHYRCRGSLSPFFLRSRRQDNHLCGKHRRGRDQAFGRDLKQGVKMLEVLLMTLFWIFACKDRLVDSMILWYII